MSSSRESPSVSVVVATRNRPQLLPRAVRAVYAQDYPGDVECLVVFDQSDGYDVPLPVAANRRLVTVANDRTPGLPGARNTGQLAARSELIAFCDDDDTWRPHKLRRQVELLLDHPEASAVGCGICIHYGDRVVDRLPTVDPVTLPELLARRISEANGSTVLTRRETSLRRIGLVDEDLPGGYAEDYDWLLRAAKVGPIRMVGEVLTDIYWHPSSFFGDRWQTIADALSYLLRKHDEFAYSPRGRARIEGQIAFAYAAIGERRAAAKWSGRALRDNPLEKRAAVACAVGCGIMSAETVTRLANARGKGI